MVDRDVVLLGVELLKRLEDPEISLADVMDRLETITAEPQLQRSIIEEAEQAGVLTVDRDTATVQTHSHEFVGFASDVITKEGSFTCRNCGRSLSTGYFIHLKPDEIGPFGSTCIRKVTGRE